MKSPIREQIECELRSFILEELVEAPYDGDDPLADEVVDSLGHEQLAEYLEETYGIRLADEDMTRENFGSLAALTSLVEAKR